MFCFRFLLGGERLCSCYSFNNKSSGYAWPQANGHCRYHNKRLVVMETEQEWEFIKNAIQNREGSKYGEWFIGLELNMTTRNWTWINGKSLTIDKWEKSSPDPDTFTWWFKRNFHLDLKSCFTSTCLFMLLVFVSFGCYLYLFIYLFIYLFVLSVCFFARCWCCFVLCVWQSLRGLFAFGIGFPCFRSFVRLKVGESVNNFARSFRGTIYDRYYNLLIYHD